ncbi:hypothetical protein PanWU01x14_273500, partial [Parasponia andersonii]
TKESLQWLEKTRWRQQIGVSAFAATRNEEEDLCRVCLCVKMANSLAEWGFFEPPTSFFALKDLNEFADYQAF